MWLNSNESFGIFPVHIFSFSKCKSWIIDRYVLTFFIKFPKENRSEYILKECNTYPKSLMTSSINRYRVTWIWELDMGGHGRNCGGVYMIKIYCTQIRNSQKYFHKITLLKWLTECYALKNLSISFIYVFCDLNLLLVIG